MRVLHCLAQLPQSTGSGIYFTNVVNGLAKRGHENAVLYGTQKPFEIKWADVNNVYPVEFKTEELPFPIVGMSDVMPYESTVYSEMTPQQYNLWRLAFRRRLEQIKDQFQPEVILTHHLWLLTSLVREVFPDTRVIGISHGTDLRQAKKNPRLKETYVQHVDKLDAYFTLAPSDMMEISHIFQAPREKMQVMGGGFNPHVFHPNGRRAFDGKFRLLFAGKIAQAKGVYELAKAVPQIVAQYPQLELRIVGNATADQIDELTALAENAPQLIFQPAVAQAELGELFRQTDLFISPSYYEGYASIVIEALAAGARAVTTEIDGLMYLLGEEINTSGIIEYIPLPGLHNIDEPDEEDIPQFIDQIAEKVMLQLERIQRGEPIKPEIISAINRLSWEHVLDDMDAFIRSAQIS